MHSSLFVNLHLDHSNYHNLMVRSLAASSSHLLRIARTIGLFSSPNIVKMLLNSWCRSEIGKPLFLDATQSKKLLLVTQDSLSKVNSTMKGCLKAPHHPPLSFISTIQWCNFDNVILWKQPTISWPTTLILFFSIRIHHDNYVPFALWSLLYFVLWVEIFLLC